MPPGRNWFITPPPQDEINGSQVDGDIRPRPITSYSLHPQMAQLFLAKYLLLTPPSFFVKRLIAIGDVHGCSEALAALIEAIKPVEEDCLVLLGDYIDRGIDSRGVIEQLIGLQDRCHVVPLLGNHEEMLLSVLGNRAPLGWWLRHGGKETLVSYGGKNKLECIPAEHIDFLKRCYPFHETESHFFVHANYVADERLDRQPAEALRWQSLDEHFPKCHASGKTAIVGHTTQKNGEIYDAGYLKCIDTFCFGGGWLTAMEMNAGQVWQASIKGVLRHQ